MIATYRYAFFLLAALGGSVALAPVASAGALEDCNTLRAAAAFAPCTLIVDDKKQSPAARAVALLMRARAALDMADLERAGADINAAFALRPGTPFGHRVRGRLRGLQGRNTEARADLSKAIQLSETPASKYVSYLDRGNFFLRILDTPSAYADFDMAIRVDPTKAAAYVGRALSNKASGKIDEALADLGRAKAVEPGYWLTFVERADILVTEKRYADAIADYDIALAMRGNDVRALRGRAAATALMSAVGKPPQTPAAAPTTLTSPETPKAAPPATPATSPTSAPTVAAPSPPPPAVTSPVAPPVVPPGSPPKVAAPAATPPPAPAAPDMPPVPPPPASRPVSPQSAPSTAPPAAPSAPSIQPATAPQQPSAAPPAQSGDDVDAAAKQAHERREKLKEAIDLRQKSKYAEALAIYDALLRQAPADAEAAVEKGRTLMALAKWKEALETFKGVHENKDVPGRLRALALEARAEVLAVNKQFEVAAHSATAALQLFPKLDRALFWRGYSTYQLGNFDRALTDMQQAATIAPKAVLYAGWEAIVQIGAGDLPKAKEAIERAAALQADNPLVLTARARLDLVSGNLPAAEAAIALLATRGPLSPVAFETQQLIMIHKVLKPSDQSAAAPRQ